MHPERIAGSGPEQDYLSRLFAPWWLNISVVWNFQLHRIFHAVDASVDFIRARGDVHNGDDWIPERLNTSIDDVRIVHFSGQLKFWDRSPGDHETDEQFVDRIIQDCSYWSGKWWMAIADGQEYEMEDSIRQVGLQGVNLARTLTCRAVRQWCEDLEALPQTCACCPPMSELLRRLREPSWPANAPFDLGAKVEVWWPKTGQWYSATVTAAYEDYS